MCLFFVLVCGLVFFLGGFFWGLVLFGFGLVFFKLRELYHKKGTKIGSLGLL